MTPKNKGEDTTDGCSNGERPDKKKYADVLRGIADRIEACKQDDLHFHASIYLSDGTQKKECDCCKGELLDVSVSHLSYSPEERMITDTIDHNLKILAAETDPTVLELSPTLKKIHVKMAARDVVEDLFDLISGLGEARCFEITEVKPEDEPQEQAAEGSGRSQAPKGDGKADPADKG
jgi:hypothetical protein